MSPGGGAPMPRPMTPPVMVPTPAPVLPGPAGGAPAPKSTSASSTRQTTSSPQSLAVVLDRWSKLAPASNVGLTARIGGGIARTGSDGRGLFALPAPVSGVSEISIDLKSLPPSREPKRIVMIGLVLPRGDGKDVRVERAFPRGTQTVSIQISVPRGGGGTVSWGDGKPPVDVTRGKPVDPPPSGPPQLMGFIGGPFWGQVPDDGDCDPQVQICGGGDNPPFDPPPPPPPPPPPDDPPIPFDPWTLPPDGDPPPQTQITFTDDDGGGGITQTQTDDNGTFIIGALDPGTHVLLVPGLMPKVRSGAPKPPVKVALVLPAGKPGQGTPLRLVEHVYARNNPGEAIRLKITVPGAAGSTSVDWGDGTSRADVARDGKKIDPSKIKSGAVGRVLFANGSSLR